MAQVWRASRWQKVINTRTVPPRRSVEKVIGSVARKDAKKVLERFLAFPEQWDFSSLVNPVRRHWHQRWEKDGKSKKRRKCDASPSLHHGYGCARDLPAQTASSTWIPSASWILTMYVFCYFRFFGQITPLEQSRKKRPLASVTLCLWLVILQWLPGRLVIWQFAGTPVCITQSCRGSALTPQWGFLIRNHRAQVGKEGASKKEVFQPSFDMWVTSDMWVRARCGLRASQTILLLSL